MSNENGVLHAQWAERIKSQRASGLSQKAWCKREGVPYSTYMGWISRLCMQQQAAAPKKASGPANKDIATFVKVEQSGRAPCMHAEVMATDSVIELSVIRMRLPAGYEPKRLCELIEGALS